MAKAQPQLLSRGRRLDLLLHVAAFVGQLDYKFSHRFACPLAAEGAAGFRLNLPAQG
jgi:hypothetical protein